MLRLLAGVLLLWTGHAWSAQSLYSITDLGTLIDLPGRTDSGPKGINQAGLVVGSNVTNGAYRAVIYNQGQKDLGTLGGDESLGGGIDDLNRVVGWAHTSGSATNAFFWANSETNGVAGNPEMVDLGTLGGPVSEAFSINSKAGITGYSDVATHSSVQQHAFVYASGKLTDIGSGQQLANSFGYSINGRGHVAGTGYDVAYSAAHAFFFDGTNSVDLGLLGGVGASALAVNDSDYLAGYFTTTAMVDRAFLYVSGAKTELGTLGGGYSYALGLNNSNVVVGGSFTDSSNTVYHAFYWSNGLMQDLNAQLDSSGAGWVLQEARAINDAGQITGVGTLNGVNHAFLLVPAPGSTNSPITISVLRNGSNLVLQFNSSSGIQYTIETNATLSASGWAGTGSSFSGTGGLLSITNAPPGVGSLFYRIKSSGH